MSLRSVMRAAAVALAVSACRPGLPEAPRAPRTTVVTATASMLPADTLAYVVAPSFESLWDRAQGDQLVVAARADAMRLFYRAEREVGVVPRPEALAAVGVEVDGPAGVALMLDEDAETIPVVFLSLAHPGRFESALLRFAAREGYGRPGAEGDAALVLGDEVAWLVRRDVAFLLPRRAHETQRRLATFTDSEPSLAERPAFRHAMAGQLRRTTALAGFVDVRGLLYADAGLDPRWAGADTAAARANLERQHRQALKVARNEGAGVRALAAIDARYRNWRAGLREDASASALRALWGEVEGAGFRLELGGSRAQLSARIAIPEAAPLARLLSRPRPARTPLKALNAPPYAAAELTAEPALLQKHLSALLPFLGRRFEGDGELLGALDGTAAVVVIETEDGPRLGARVGLKDAGIAQSQLDEVGRDGSVHADGADVILGVPGVPPVRVGVRAGAVVASSHRDLFDRLAQLPETPSYGDQSRVARVLRRSPSAFVMGGAVGALVAGPIPSSLGRAPSPPPPSVPKTDRERIQVELDRIDYALKQVERRRLGRLITLRRAWSDALGQLALTLGWSGDALRLEVRWERSEGPVGEAVVRLLEGAPGRDDPALETDDLDALLGQLNVQRFELLGRLGELEDGASVPTPQ